METNYDPVVRLNLMGHAKDVTALKFRNNNQLLSGSNDCCLLLWNLNTPELRTYRFAQHTEAVNDVDSSANEKIIASCSNDKQILLWSPSLRHGTTAIQAHMKSITTLNLSRNGRRIISGSTDKCMKLWDVTLKKFIHSYVGHNHFVNCARFASDDHLVVSCAEDKTVKVWDLENKICIANIVTPKASANKIAIYDRYVACAMQSGSVRVYDYLERKLIQHYVLNNGCINDIAWHPRGQYMLAASNDGSICILDLLEGRPIYKLHAMNKSITSVAYTPSGESFACGGSNKEILIWDFATLTTRLKNESSCFSNLSNE